MNLLAWKYETLKKILIRYLSTILTTNIKVEIL